MNYINKQLKHRVCVGREGNGSNSNNMIEYGRKMIKISLQFYVFVQTQDADSCAYLAMHISGLDNTI